MEICQRRGGKSTLFDFTAIAISHDDTGDQTGDAVVEGLCSFN